jgi:hypothetical protein
MTGKSRTSNSTSKAGQAKATRGVTTDKRAKARPAGLFGIEPKPWPQPVEGVELLDALVASFRRYLALPKGAAETLALWAVFTHAIDASAVAPRLAILSPTPRCGKTTLLGLLIRLVRQPLPASNVSPAALYRVIEQDRPTLLIDEADTFLAPRSELIGILNSGHSRDTAFIVRCEGDSHDVKPFGTYTAIAIAKIGKLPAALHDRCLVIRMQRKGAGDKIERFREDRVASDLLALKRKAARWAADNVPTLRKADPDIPKVLHDRAADNWRLMIAVADLADGHWPETARRVAVLISGEEEDSSLAVQLLHDIRDIFDALQKDRLPTALLLGNLVNREDRPWATLIDGMPLGGHRFASMLEPFGIRPKVLRIGEKTLRGYERLQFADAWARYPQHQTATPKHECNINGLDGTKAATQSATDVAASATGPVSVADRQPDVAGDVAVLKAENYNDFNDVAGVALYPEGKPGAQADTDTRIDMEALFDGSRAGLESWAGSRRRRRKPRLKSP